MFDLAPACSLSRAHHPAEYIYFQKLTIAVQPKTFLTAVTFYFFATAF